MATFYNQINYDIEQYSGTSTSKFESANYVKTISANTTDTNVYYSSYSYQFFAISTNDITEENASYITFTVTPSLYGTVRKLSQIQYYLNQPYYVWYVSSNANITSITTTTTEPTLLTLNINDDNVFNSTYETSINQDTKTAGIVLTCNTDYTFDSTSIPYLTYTDSSGNTQTISGLNTETTSQTLSIDSDVLEYLNTTSGAQTVYLYSNPVSTSTPTVEPTIDSSNLSNATYTNTSLSGTTIGITITANDYCIFKEDNLPYAQYTYNGETTTISSLNIASDVQSVTLSIDSEKTAIIQNNGLTIYLYGTAVSDYIQIKSQNIANCSYTYTPDIITKDNSVTISFTANTGFQFTTTPYIAYNDYSVSGGTIQYIEATISEDKLTATLTIDSTVINNIYTWNTDLSIYVYSTATSISGLSYAFTNIYTITLDELNKIASTRFVEKTSNYYYELIDISQYIISLKRFYCDVETGESSLIALGNFNSGAYGNVVTKEQITIDCGTITVVGQNNNDSDYTATLKLLLPFIGLETLDPDTYMNQTIHLLYEVSVLSGSCVAKLSINDNITDIFTGNITESYPYVLSNVSRSLDVTYDNSNIMYGFTPVLTVYYHSNYSENVLLDDNKYAQLNTLSGKCMIDHVNVTIENITNAETDMLIDVLQNGVIF